MKILLTSYVFSPSIGGIETVSALLASEFVKAGHEVKVVTRTPREDGIARPYEVIREPSAWQFMKLANWCDVFFQNNISLELAWPLLLVGRPWVVASHTMLDHNEGRIRWRSTLKNFLLRYAYNITITRFLGSTLKVPSVVVGNPYSISDFHQGTGEDRHTELVYLGRLVSDKGIDLIITALVELEKDGLRPRLSIIGQGPEEVPLREQAERLGVADRVNFVGAKKGEELARLLNRHKIMIVPSRWAEPFGIVVLEGIACGCAVITSDNGGLPEAKGPCGVTFRTDNVASLTEVLRAALTEPGFRERMQKNAASHLAQFEPSRVAARYLEIFEEAITTERR